MTAAGILDTTTLVQLARLDPEELPDGVTISVVTLAELTAGPLVTVDEAERVARLAHLQYAEKSFDPLPFDEAAARAYARLLARLRHSARPAPARVFDVMVAATAVAAGLPLYTTRPDDYQGMDELVLHPISRSASTA
jgi:predicted nucleic acid-binding protein